MTGYRLQVKSVGAFDSAGAPPVPAEPDQSQEQDEAVAQHEWAGDLFESDDESEPEAAFAAFTGGAGEESWLDAADDGTLTGWVRDADGSLYRYSDVDAWAIDVDQASMDRQDPADLGGDDLGAAGEVDENGDPIDPDDPMGDPDPDAEGTDLDEDGFPLDADATDDEFEDDPAAAAPADGQTELVDGEEVPVEGDPDPGEPGVDEELPIDDEDDLPLDDEDEDDPANPFRTQRKAHPGYVLRVRR